MTEWTMQEPPPVAKSGRPPHKTPIGRWLLALRDHPGEWSRFEKCYPNQSSLSHIKGDVEKGRRYGVKAGEYEVTSRKHDDGNYVYARFLGELEADVVDLAAIGAGLLHDRERTAKATS